MPVPRYDGLDAHALARRCGVPRVALFPTTTSSMDEAHALAANGAPAGTLVLANEQTAGRGRSGGRWLAEPGRAVLLTLIERPRDAVALGVLSLRAGLAVADALDAVAGERVQLKWPNDVMLAAGKAAGILIEARWRGDQIDWVAVAMGINVGSVPAGVPGAAALPGGIPRLSVIDAVVPALRATARATGTLTDAEVTRWRDRDWLAGKRAAHPVAGTISGILPTGELVIESADGTVAYRGAALALEGS